MAVTSKHKRPGNPGEVPISFADSQSRFDCDAVEARWTFKNQHGNQRRIFRHGIFPNTLPIRPAEVAGRDSTTEKLDAPAEAGGTRQRRPCAFFGEDRDCATDMSGGVEDQADGVAFVWLVCAAC
jgi:hypothetical protein